MCSVASVVSSSATPWTVAHPAPLSMGFSRQEYWSGLPYPSPGDLPNPGIEPSSPMSPALHFTTEPLGKPKLKARPHNYLDFLLPLRGFIKQSLMGVLNSFPYSSRPLTVPRKALRKTLLLLGLKGLWLLWCSL